jgi:cellulose synthase/poly-beta-1,6-N-acetylglucosamine synthase-like glycosyltransferase
MSREAILILIFLGLLAHSYLIYPLLLRILVRIRKQNKAEPPAHEKPFISILIPAHNEEDVIEEKIKSVLNSNYPKDKMEILIGLDHCTDRTEEIVKSIAETNSLLLIKKMQDRSGKSGVINALVPESKGEILVITDANILLLPDTLNNLVRGFSDPRTGLIDTRMRHIPKENTGISGVESGYVNTEVGTKNAESVLWGCMMGPFGGCFAVRKKLFRPIPSHFLVDDFFLNMVVLKSCHKSKNAMEAEVLEDVSTSLREEFRRKIRIATGNFQNLIYFFPLLFRFNALSFCFFSHKVIRWIGPFLYIAALGITILKAIHFPGLWIVLLAGALVLPFVLTLADILLTKLGVNLMILRPFSHLVSMNLALFIGFFRFLSGVKSGAWKPTRRNQAG